MEVVARRLPAFPHVQSRLYYPLYAALFEISHVSQRKSSRVVLLLATNSNPEKCKRKQSFSRIAIGIGIIGSPRVLTCFGPREAAFRESRKQTCSVQGRCLILSLAILLGSTR
jgi:hypothetical protein